METFIVEVALAMLVSYVAGSWARKYFKDAGLVGKDVHKKGEPKLPTSAGIPVFLGFYFSAMAYIFLRTYVFGDYSGLLDVIAGILSISFVTFVGFFDDVNSADGRRIGLKQWQKPLLTLPAAIPLMALKIGNTSMALPFFGSVDFGVFYTLTIIPIAVIGASNMVNLLAGLNGLESGMGIIYLLSLSLYSYFHAGIASSIIAFGALGAVAGIFLLNKFPAKLLPGDSFTYFLGGTLASIAIIGNMEKAALVASIPFLIEGLLKARGRFKKPTIGNLKNGKIMREGGIYSLPHIFMNGKYTEKQVVQIMWVIAAFFSAIAWLV